MSGGKAARGTPHDLLDLAGVTISADNIATAYGDIEYYAPSRRYRLEGATFHAAPNVARRSAAKGTSTNTPVDTRLAVREPPPASKTHNAGVTE